MSKNKINFLHQTIPNNAKQDQNHRNPPPHVGGYGREKGVATECGEGTPLWGVLGARVLGAA
jgi:hypothetical protein